MEDGSGTDREAQDQILKADRRGRVRTPPDQQLAILEEWDRSGLSGARFADLHGIHYQTLMSWKRKHRGPRPEVNGSSKARLDFLEVAIPAQSPAACSSLRIELPGGVCLHVSTSDQASLAAHLIRRLSA